MKILLLGGTGNISTAITCQLLEQGHEVLLFKRTPTLPPGSERATVICGERSDLAASREQLWELGALDCVIDMICYTPAEAEAAVKIFRGRTRQFLFCSTVDVYAKDQPSYPLTERAGKIGASESFPYAYQKVKCEEIFWNAHRHGDFAVTVLRPAFTYNETWSPGIHSFGGQTYHLDRLAKGKPIILHGDGNSIWTATYRDDVAAAFVGAAGNAGAYGQAYNVTGEEWMTHTHIWRTLAQLLDAPEPEFIYIPSTVLATLAPQQAKGCVENFQYNNIFDNSKARRDLGFRYTVTFEQGAARCLRYLKAHNAIEDCEKYPFYDRLVELWRGLLSDCDRESQK